jgi:multiple sugar transport system permease protein
MKGALTTANLALLVVCAVVFIIPFVWMVETSLNFHSPGPDGQAGLLGNYTVAMDRMGDFFRLVLNTSVLTAASILFQVFTCSLAGFAFARLQFRGREFLFVLVLATMMLPMQVTVIPQFVLFQSLGWVDTFLPILAPALLGGNPFFIFLFRQFFLTIPKETVEVARLDGCGTFGIYWRIMLPLARPAVGAVAIFTFLMVWNDLWGPLIYLNSPENATLTLALAGFARSFRVAVDLLMAGAVMVILPCIVVYFAAQKYFIRGINLTGGKG